MKKEIRTIIASLFVFGLSSEGAVSVTASRTYVDSRTSLSPVTNNGQVVGFKLGIHTNGNEVLAAKSYVDNSTPGDYATVSNAAISAAAQTNDFLRKTGGTMTGTISMSSGSRLHFAESSGGNGPLGAITSGSTNLTAREEMENYVTNITSKINDEIDYTTGNTQLVSTIESVAPVPGNYTVVSNAAMNARSGIDLGVRGAPQGEGSWFVVCSNGINRVLTYDDKGDPVGWSCNDMSIGYMGENYYYMTIADFMFSLTSNFSCETEYNGIHYVIVGYTNTLAQVSQIPVLPSGIVTTNGQGIVKFSGDRLSIENEAFKGSKLVVGRVLADVVTNKIVVSSTYNGGSIELQSNGSFDGKGMIRISGAGVDILGNTIDPEISVSGTNIIPIVFGAAHKSDIDYTTSNQQLVDTIEATAPAPGDYANVSNAAMRARSMTDLSYNGIVTNDFWDVTGGVSVRLYRKQIPSGLDYWESQDGVWGLAYAEGDWLFGRSQNAVYIYEPADAGSLSCTIGGTAYFLTRVSGKSGMIALTNDIPNTVTSILSETLDSYATKEYADSAPSSIVTKAYIQEKLEVYLYIGQDGGVYVRMPGN